MFPDLCTIETPRPLYLLRGARRGLLLALGHVLRQRLAVPGAGGPGLARTRLPAVFLPVFGSLVEFRHFAFRAEFSVLFGLLLAFR